jgi:molybdopterin converting factor small subunit
MSSTDNSFIEIKVAYLLMAQYIDTTEEYFALQTPATLSALLGAVSEKHPILSTMIPSMQILLDGIPTVQFNAALKDGDEVDFVPIVAGG